MRVSGQHLFNGATQRAWHFGPSAEPHDQIRPSRAKIEPRRKLRTQWCDFDRLVQKRRADPECGRLQGKPFVAAADLDPVSSSKTVSICGAAVITIA